MVHQYIGARYVPYYYENSLDPTSTEWEPNVHYEALTVVTLPNNHSYISKKDVPDTIGTPASNAEYWLDTGSDNAYIQDLQDQIDLIVLDVSAAQGDISNLQTDTQQLYKMQQNLSTHNVIIVSDSYGDTPNDWPDKLAALAGWDSDHYHNLSVSGSAFYGNAGAGPHFIDQITNYGGDRDEITDIIVCGGINDAYYDSNTPALNQAIADFCDYAKAEYPNATIHIGFIGHILQSSPHLNGRTWKKVQFTCRTYYYQAALNGVNILNNVEYALSQIVTALDADGLHPSATGSVLLGNAIFEALTTGSAKIIWPDWGASSLLSYEMDNNLLTIYRTVPSAFHFDVATLSGSWEEVTNDTFSALYFNEPVYVDCVCMLNGTSLGSFATAPVKLKFEGDKIYAKTLQTKSDYSGYETFSPAGGNPTFGIYPHELTITVPSKVVN